MADTLAVLHVLSGVTAIMAADAAAADPPVTPAPHVFGWRRPAQQSAVMRVVWVPGDDKSSRAGEVGGAKQPGRTPRSLATFAELVTVYLEGVDVTGLEDETLQYAAARNLFDAWFRATYKTARGAFELVAVDWVTGKRERRYGATLRVLMSVEAFIPDSPRPVPATPTEGLFETELGDTAGEPIAVGTAPPYAVVATTGPITLAGEQSIDGQGVIAGDRVLVKDQADATTNGLYVVSGGAWSRAPDADEDSEVTSGFFVHTQPGGAVNGDAGFEITTDDPIELGVTELVFERVSP